MATLTEKNISLKLAYSLRSLVPYCHGRKHGNMQIDLMLEKELRALLLDQQAAGRVNETGPGLSI